MSILAPLERLFESPAKIEARQRERDAEVVAAAQDAEGDPPHRLYRCRVCEFESVDRAYCPTCLADTMVAGTVPRP